MLNSRETDVEVGWKAIAPTLLAARKVRTPLGVNLRMLPLSLFATNKLSALSIARPVAFVKSARFWELLRLHVYGPSIMIFEKSAKGGLCVDRIQPERVRPDAKRTMQYADSLEKNDRIDRRKIDRDPGSEGKAGVEVQQIAGIDHGSAIDLEVKFQRPKHAQRHKRVGWRTVSVVCAEEHPEREHEALPLRECDVDMTGRPVPGDVGQRHEHDIREDNSVAIGVSLDSYRAEAPTLISGVVNG